MAERRYIICLHPHEAAEDAAARQAMLAEKFKPGAMSMMGNRGYRRFLEIGKGAGSLDPAKIAADARFDGKYVWSWCCSMN